LVNNMSEIDVSQDVYMRYRGGYGREVKPIEQILVETILDEIRRDPQNYIKIIAQRIDLITPQIQMLLDRAKISVKKTFWEILKSSWRTFFRDIPNPLKFEKDIDLTTFFQRTYEMIRENKEYEERFIKRYIGYGLIRGSEIENKLREIISLMLFHAYIRYLKDVRGLIE